MKYKTNIVLSENLTILYLILSISSKIRLELDFLLWFDLGKARPVIWYTYPKVILTQNIEGGLNTYLTKIMNIFDQKTLIKYGITYWLEGIEIL